jgi:hypothetical protein
MAHTLPGLGQRIFFDGLALRLLKQLLGGLSSILLTLLLGFVDLIHGVFFVLRKAYILLIFIHDGERHFGLLDDVL